MSDVTVPSTTTPRARTAPRLPLLRTDDACAIAIGLGLLVLAVVLYKSGSSLSWLAVAPQKWSHWGEVPAQLKSAGGRYVALLVLWSGLLALASAALGLGALGFLRAFIPLFLFSGVLYVLGFWDQAAHYNLEPPLVALVFGLLIANTVGTPRWLEPGLRVELYIKTGIVLLGASLPLSLLAWAGPVALGQAAIVSLATFGVIFASATALGLEPRLAATLGTGGAVCGVSGAIAVGGAVGARRQDISVTISLVVIWAIVMIFVLPLTARMLHLPTGVAGAWIGTSEFADAAGLAAAQTYAGYAGHLPDIAGRPEAAVTAFTLMKVIGRDLWIGVWAFVLALIAAAYWDRTGVEAAPDAREIARRFPKFVLGFLLAAALVSVLAHGDDYATYKREVVPGVVAPLQVLRTWIFTVAFLAIGLTTRLGDLARIGVRPLLAFTAGVLVNLALGFWLSTQLFRSAWEQLNP